MISTIFHIEVELVKTEYGGDGSIGDETIIDTHKIALGSSKAFDDWIKKLKEDS